MMLKIEQGGDFGSLVWTHNVIVICYNDSMSVIVFVKIDEGRIYRINKRLELSGASSLWGRNVSKICRMQQYLWFQTTPC